MIAENTLQFTNGVSQPVAWTAISWLGLSKWNYQRFIGNGTWSSRKHEGLYVVGTYKFSLAIITTILGGMLQLLRQVRWWFEDSCGCFRAHFNVTAVFTCRATTVPMLLFGWCCLVLLASSRLTCLLHHFDTVCMYLFVILTFVRKCGHKQPQEDS